MSLTEFLLARIAEDEAAAKGHEGTAFHEWEFVKYRDRAGGYIPGRVADDWHDGAFVAVSEHIARHDPARVLADVEAKRRIVMAAVAAESTKSRESGVRGLAAELIADTLGDALRALALPYADHPDYNESWKP